MAGQVDSHAFCLCRVLINTASKGKYAQVLGQVGGYGWLQRLLTVLHGIAESHSVSVADVAAKWVLDKPTVGAVIIGAAVIHCVMHSCSVGPGLSD